MIKLQAVVKKEINIPEGFTGVQLRDHTIINVNGELPPEFDYLRISIEAEWGTGRTSTGNAQICTTLKGKQLKGFNVVTAGEGKLATGWVNVSAPFVIVNVNRTGNNITATIHKATIVTPEDFNPGLPPIKEELLWSYEGDLNDISLPEKLLPYEDALFSAITKSQCWHCHCLHFYGRN